MTECLSLSKLVSGWRPGDRFHMFPAASYWTWDKCSYKCRQGQTDEIAFSSKTLDMFNQGIIKQILQLQNSKQTSWAMFP